MDERSRTGRRLADDLLVLLHHPVTGRPLLSSGDLDRVLGGALLSELIDRGRIELSAPRRLTGNRSVRLRDPAPTGDDALDDALRRLGRSRARRSQAAVAAISTGLTRQLRERLVARGEIQIEDPRLVGIVPARVWSVDRRQPDELIAHLREILSSDEPAPPRRDSATVALLHSVRRVGAVVGGQGESGELIRRARAIAAGDPVAQAVRRARAAAAF